MTTNLTKSTGVLVVVIITSCFPGMPTIGAASTKWHPGHYVLVPLGMAEKGFERVLMTIERTPQFRGIQKRYTWGAMEPTEGQYDFSEIKTDLRRLAAIHKRLVVQIQTKSFVGDRSYAPAYLKAPAFAGGVYKLSAGGYNIILWNNAVLERLKALYRAMGQELAGEAFLEALVIPETAPGPKADRDAAGYDEAAYIDNLIAAATALRKAFPHTVVIQYANYPIKALEKLTEASKTLGIGLGGPDVFTASPSLNAGVYSYYPRLAGTIPLAIGVQDENYTARYHKGPFSPTPVQELHEFARNKLKVNYVFWLWKRAPVDYFSQVEAMVKALSFPGDRAGGLETTCPMSLGNCIE